MPRPIAFAIIGAAISCIVAGAASAQMSPSEAAHIHCMEVFQEGAAQELHRKMRPLSASEAEWDRMVSVILETYHVACFTLLGVEDNRDKDNQMPWVSPGPICQ